MTNADQLMLVTEIIPAYSENHLKHVYTLWAKRVIFLMLKREVHAVITVR
jgi:hypothetical protein